MAVRLLAFAVEAQFNSDRLTSIARSCTLAVFFYHFPFDEFHSSSNEFLFHFVPERSFVLERKLSLPVPLGFLNQ